MSAFLHRLEVGVLDDPEEKDHVQEAAYQQHRHKDPLVGVNRTEHEIPLAEKPTGRRYAYHR